MSKTEIIICGEAPSRQGDGRPFTGPSGERLVTLFGLRDYEHLASQFTLINIYQVSQEPGGRFEEPRAREVGQRMAADWARQPHHIAVIACGAKTFRALTGTRIRVFRGVPLRLGPAQGVDIWHFPHPSGLSRFWNEPENVDRAALFLKRFLKQYGCSITE